MDPLNASLCNVPCLRLIEPTTVSLNISFLNNNLTALIPLVHCSWQMSVPASWGGCWWWCSVAACHQEYLFRKPQSLTIDRLLLLQHGIAHTALLVVCCLSPNTLHTVLIPSILSVHRCDCDGKIWFMGQKDQEMYWWFLRQKARAPTNTLPLYPGYNV